jgi:hypothetical protein
MSKKIWRSESEYMLLFRGTSWHQGLSSETVQAVMNQWYDWFEQLVEQGRATSGRPLAYQGKIVSGKKGHTVIDGPFVESKEAIGCYFLLHVANEGEANRNCQALPGTGTRRPGGSSTCRGILPFGRACDSSRRAAARWS